MKTTIDNILEGILAFQKHEVNSRDGYYKELANGQSPSAMMITCSDSRIDPNLITQTDLGELFVLRNAGNIVPAHSQESGGEAGTIEYAIQALGVEHIIICGHSHCGAMKGLLNPESLATLPATASWIKNAEATRSVVEHKCGHLDDDEKVLEAAKENVLVQLNNLRTLPAVSAKLATGQLQVHGWVYEIETGEMLCYDEQEKSFSPLVDKLHPVEKLAV